MMRIESTALYRAKCVADINQCPSVIEIGDGITGLVKSRRHEERVLLATLWNWGPEAVIDTCAKQSFSYDAGINIQDVSWHSSLRIVYQPPRRRELREAKRPISFLPLHFVVTAPSLRCTIRLRMAMGIFGDVDSNEHACPIWLFEDEIDRPLNADSMLDPGGEYLLPKVGAVWGPLTPGRPEWLPHRHLLDLRHWTS